MRSVNPRAPIGEHPDLGDLVAVGDYLRDARRRAGISQQLLGLMTGMTQQTVSRWEQGRGAPEPATRGALVDILDLPADPWAAGSRRAAAAPASVTAASLAS
jgi:transcriptional regulator with XRE-family HTH domain